MTVGVQNIASTDDCYRIFLDYSTIDLHDHIIVNELELFLTVDFQDNTFDCDVHQVTGLGILALFEGNQTLIKEFWDMQANDTKYVDDSTFCAGAADETRSVVLGSAANIDFQNQLNTTILALNNTFTISVIAGNETLDPVLRERAFIHTTAATNLAFRPALQLSYNDTHHFATFTDELAIQDEGFIPTFARTINFTAFAGSIGSRDAPFTVFDDGNNDLCDNTQQPSGTGAILRFGWFETSSSNDCYNSVILWDIDSIPDGSVILNVSTILKGQLTSAGIQLQNNQCEFNHIGTFPPLSNDAAKGADARDGENFLTDANCSTKLGIGVGSGETTEPAIEFDLGNATGEVQARLGTGSSTACTGCTGFDWFAVGLDFDQGSKNGTNREVQEVSGDTDTVAVLKVRFQSATDNITDLTAVGRFVDVDLDWSAPTTYGFTQIVGYQINFTSPQGNPPLTVVVNDTGSTTTDALITGLTAGANFTFRIATWDDSLFAIELSNEANATTITLGNFTIGTLGNTTEFSLNLTQADARDIKYIRTDVTDTQTVIEVIHPNSFTLQCDMYFKLAISNQTFTGLTTVPEGATEQKATFTFNNQQNDIIEITCFDTATNVSADYLVTQSVESSFLLLEQFQNFRDGTYGTQGQFGSIDLITLGAVIVAMIGFNRVNETVGAIFTVVILGMLSFFEIVVWQTFMFGTVAAVLMLVVASTRKR